LRAAIVTLPVVREDRRDRVEWTSGGAIVTGAKEVEHLRIETVQQVSDAAIELF
jgi:hypothetical protein